MAETQKEFNFKIHGKTYKPAILDDMLYVPDKNINPALKPEEATYSDIDNAFPSDYFFSELIKGELDTLDDLNVIENPNYMDTYFIKSEGRYYRCDEDGYFYPWVKTLDGLTEDDIIHALGYAPLSEADMNVIYDEIDNIFNSELPDVIKGSKASMSALNSLTDSVPGDIWFVVSEGKYYKFSIDGNWSEWSTVRSAITKEDLGLGNVENKSSETIRNEITSDDVVHALGFKPLTDEVNFDFESIRNELAGKVNKSGNKVLTDNNLSDELKGKYDDAVNKAHTHSNKNILDKTTESFTTEKNNKINTNEANISTLKDASHTHTNKTVLDGITQEQLDKIDTHNQASSTITSMTGYSKPLSTSSILESDTLNDAIGKLEKAMDGKSSTSHTHSSYVNQDAFSNVKVGDVTVAADSATDTLTLVSGTNVTITPDATNDTITIAAKDTTYGAATTSTSGLMSAADKTKLDGIASGANKYSLPEATSSVLGGVKVGSNISVSSGAISISKSNVTSALGYTPISSTLKGANSGVAELDENGKVLTSQLPSYVDDVIEATALSKFPSTGEAGKIYVDTSTNKTYRWSGSGYTEISASLALGETSSTAYRGDRGKVAYEHSQATHARTDATKVEASTTNGNIKINGTETKVYTHPSGTNPHGTTKSDVGLGNVPNVATNDQTPTYSEASTLAKLSSGEKLSVAFGKISKGVTDLISHLADSVKHITSTERTNWNAAKTHADSAHAPSSAQANVIETVKVNGTALTPSSKAVNITVPVTTDTYSSTGTAPVNGKAVASAIGTLDVAAVSVGTTETIKSISETDGKIAVTKQSIAIKSNQVNGMTSYSKATSSSAIATSDSLNTAVGKLEYKVDTNETNISNANTQIADIYNRCGGGKNLFKTPTNVSSVYRGLTFSWDSDGVLTVTGIPSIATDSYIPQYPYITTGSQFTAPCDCILYISYSETHADMWISVHGYSADGQQFYKSSSAVALSAGDRIAGLYFRLTNTTTDYNFTVKFMIIPNDIGINAATYVPYIPTNAELYSMFENRKVYQAANWLKTFTINKVNLSNVITKIYIKHNTFLKEFIIVNNTVFGDASNTNLSYTLSDGNVTFTCVDTMLAFVEQYIC